jgi:hypothetical protein
VTAVSRRGRSMDDRRAQFLIAVADLCGAASLAGLEVEVRPAGGPAETARGIPHPHAASGGDEVEATGYGRTLAIDGRILNLDEVEQCTIFAPLTTRER